MSGAAERAASLIRELALEALPEEGGFYRRVYESDGVFTPEQLAPAFAGRRYHCTSIHYLLIEPDISAMHVLRQDEIWHFYEGSPVSVCAIKPNGETTVHRLGADHRAGELRQIGMRAGWIFGGRIEEPGGMRTLAVRWPPVLSSRIFACYHARSWHGVFPRARQSGFPTPARCPD